MKRVFAFGIIISMFIFLAGCGTAESQPDFGERKSDVKQDEEVVDSEAGVSGEASVVYFTSNISSEGMVAVYEALGWEPAGRVAVKLSTGEPPASNYLQPELIKDLVELVDGTIVECNTAYGGSRAETGFLKIS